MFLGWPDIAGLTRGRGIPVADLEARKTTGIGWVPVAQALTPFSTLAANPWGPMGDIWLLPDPAAGARADLWPDQAPFNLMLCDGINPDGSPWMACLREFLRRALDELREEFGLSVLSAFEQEFYLDGLTEVPGANYSLIAHQLAADFGSQVIAALRAAGQQPETFEPEGGPAQYEVNCRPALGLAGADRALIMREIVRDVARRLGHRATFTPVVAEVGFGNGVHVHMSLRDGAGRPRTHDPDGVAGMSRAAGSFVAGILRHLPALTAFGAPSPVSYCRLAPGHWAGAAAAFGADNREAALRLCRGREGAGFDAGAQFNIEFRAADAAASPHLLLAVLVRAGLEGLRENLAAPAPLDRDPADLSAAERQQLGMAALPGSLEEALAAASRDDTVRGWFGDEVWSSYHALKRHELEFIADMTMAERIAAYRKIY
ncbi:MAG: glutamine synthetase family protein [Alphaproteobacteria bacterium]|nr:glutamine synthetase family protein [Alphaproteobacteria bacterium]